MEERTISAGGQVKIKSIDGADGYLLPAAGFYFFPPYESGLGSKRKGHKDKQ